MFELWLLVVLLIAAFCIVPMVKAAIAGRRESRRTGLRAVDKDYRTDAGDRARIQSAAKGPRRKPGATKN